MNQVNQVSQVNIDRPNIKLSPIIGALVLAWTGAVSEVAWAQTAAEPLAQHQHMGCLLYTSPSPRDGLLSRMPSSA